MNNFLFCRLVARLLSCFTVGLTLISAGWVLGQSDTNSRNLPGAASIADCKLIIHVDGMRNSRGKVGTVVFQSSAGWPEDTTKALFHGPTDIVSAPVGYQATQAWEHLRAGDYAVAAIHDENSNQKLDKNMFGWPLEGFGFANNPHVGLKAPNFDQATIHVGCPATETTIHMQYR